MHKVCLIRPGCKEMIDDKMDIPYGVLCLGTAIKKYGYDLVITDLSGGREYGDIPEADLYGISSYSVTYSESIKIRDWIRKNYPKKPIMIGGPHATIEYEKMLDEDFDAICVGEGEITVPPNIEKIILGSNDKVIFGKSVDDLDYYCPDYSLLNIDEYHRSNQGKKTISIMTSRGCLFQCKYCWNVHNGKKVRYRSPSSMFQELLILKNSFGIQHICFLDDSFLTDEKRARKIMMYLSELELSWEAECNIIHLQESEMCQFMKRTGCTNVFFGLESGSDLLLKKMSKPQNTAMIRKGVHNLKAAGIIVRGSLMVGFPGETWETLNETINLVKEIGLDEFSVYTFTPYPGTDPYYNPKKYGIEITAKSYEDFYMVKGDEESSYCFKSDTLNEKVLKQMREYLLNQLDNTKSAKSINEEKYTIKKWEELL